MRVRRHGRLNLGRWNEVCFRVLRELLVGRVVTKAAMRAVCTIVDVVRPSLKWWWWLHELRASGRRTVARAMLEGPWAWLMLLSKGRLGMEWLLAHKDSSIVVEGSRSSWCGGFDGYRTRVLMVPCLGVGGREHAMGVGERVLAERGTSRTVHVGIQYGRIQHR